MPAYWKPEDWISLADHYEGLTSLGSDITFTVLMEMFKEWDRNPKCYSITAFSSSSGFYQALIIFHIPLTVI